MSSTPEQHEWQSCQQGEIAAVTGRLVREERARVAKRAVKGGALSGLGVVAVLAIVMLTQPGRDASLPGGITCQHCAAAMTDYSQHLAGDAPMEPEMAQQVAGHLAACEKCRNHFEDRYPGLLAQSLQIAGRQLAMVDSRWALVATVVSYTF